MVNKQSSKIQKNKNKKRKSQKYKMEMLEVNCFVL